MGNLYRIQGKYIQAIEHYQWSMAIDEELKDSVGVAISRVNIGLIHKQHEDYDKALENYDLAYKAFAEQEHHFGMAVSLGNLGEIYLKTDQHKKAIENYRKSIENYKKFDSDCRIIFSQLGMGDAFVAMEQNDSAKLYYDRAIAGAVTCENPLLQVQCLIGLGKISVIENELDLAEERLTKAFDIAIENDFSNPVGSAALGLSELYEFKNNPDKALHYYKIYHVTKDSLLNEAKIRDVARLEYQYERDKELQVALLDQEKKEAEYQAALRSEEFLLEVSIGVILIVLIVAFAYYKQYFKKKRHNILLAQKNRLITDQNVNIRKKSKELKEANLMLKELSDFRDGLTHMVAHDMKNSLNVIIGLSEKEEKNTKMNLISQSGRLMLNLVMNMLQAQKFEEKKFSLEKSKYKVSEILAEVNLQVALLLQMNGVHLTINNEANPEVKVDKEIMMRVIINLLTNAIKYSPAGATVRLDVLHVNESQELLEIKVIDQGVGISEEKLPHIFDKYWQDNGRSTGKDASTGLGLTFCKLAIEAHGGIIKALSCPKKGTAFVIQIPMEGDHIEDVNNMGHWECEEEANTIDVVLNEDAEIIEKYKSILREYKVYQITHLQKVMKELEQENISSKWKDDLRAAVLKGDEDKFIELVG